MTAVEGRVPVSWDECADWLDAGQVVGYETRFSRGRIYPSLADDVRRNGIIGVELSSVRLLPPVGLVAAPEGMDGGGWLGEGRHVPEGWEWRPDCDGDWVSSNVVLSTNSIVQCRPVRVRPTVEVPLTQLVGRTIAGCDKPVWDWAREDKKEYWSASIYDDWLPFPEGTLDLATARVAPVNWILEVFDSQDASRFHTYTRGIDRFVHTERPRPRQ